MCIRDSLQPVRAVDPDGPLLRDLDPDRTRLASPPAGRRRDCLLYTSDAADERSSVDLGGRRIIKKKHLI